MENGMTEAHWIKLFDDEVKFECSECGVDWVLDEGTPFDNEMYYCPRCGAKMSEFIEYLHAERVVS